MGFRRGRGARSRPARQPIPRGRRTVRGYLAWDDELHTLVVAKVPRPDLVDHLGARNGLASEARALPALAHPNILRAFDAVLDGDRPHLVLEYLDGPRLSTLTRRYGLAVEQVLPLVLELSSALHYMPAEIVYGARHVKAR